MSDLFCAECVRSSSMGDFWFPILFLLGAAVAGFYFAFKYLRQARFIEDTPTSKIRSAAQGFVELIGMGKEHTNLLSSPLTAASCIWYRFKIEEYRRSGKNSSWHTIESETSDALFELHDGSGVCVVAPKGADVHTHRKKTWRGSMRHPIKMVSTGILGSLLGGRFRYTEERIHENDPVYALGFFESLGGGRTGFDMKEAVRQVVNEWKADYQSLLVKFDVNGDGEIDLQEWQQVRAAAKLDAEKLKQEHQDAPTINMLAKPPGHYPFLLGTKSQEELAKRYRWYSFGCVAVFLAAGTVSVWLIGARFS